MAVALNAIETTGRIHNTNTDKITYATLLVIASDAAANRKLSIDGVSGNTARVQLDFIGPAGARTGRLLPTGNAGDQMDDLSVICVDVGNPNFFVRADALEIGITLRFAEKTRLNVPLSCTKEGCCFGCGQSP